MTRTEATAQAIELGRYPREWWAIPGGYDCWDSECMAPCCTAVMEDHTGCEPGSALLGTMLAEPCPVQRVVAVGGA